VYDEEEIKRKTKEIAVVDKTTYLVSYFPVGDTRAHSVYDTRAFKARVERSAVGRRVIAFAPTLASSTTLNSKTSGPPGARITTAFIVGSGTYLVAIETQ
jgi:hypothetical protein